MEPIIDGIISTYVAQGINLGTSWLAQLLRKQRQPAHHQAQKNFEYFADVLVKRIEHLELMQADAFEMVKKAMERPDYFRLMDAAALGAAMTEDVEKHEILADIIINRLLAENESTLALVSQIACEAVPYLNHNHLGILGFLYTLTHLSFSPEMPHKQEDLLILQVDYLQREFKPYLSLECLELDVMHLDAVRCVGSRQGFLANTVQNIIQSAFSSLHLYDAFKDTDEGQHVHYLFEAQKLLSVILTSTGSLIGLYTAARLAHREPDTSTWRG